MKIATTQAQWVMLYQNPLIHGLADNRVIMVVMIERK